MKVETFQQAGHDDDLFGHPIDGGNGLANELSGILLPEGVELGGSAMRKAGLDDADFLKLLKDD